MFWNIYRKPFQELDFKFIGLSNSDVLHTRKTYLNYKPNPSEPTWKSDRFYFYKITHIFCILSVCNIFPIIIQVLQYMHQVWFWGPKMTILGYLPKKGQTQNYLVTPQMAKYPLWPKMTQIQNLTQNRTELEKENQS